MKQGLLLTLKQLIKLGIIKIKKRKRRASYNPRGLTTMASMDKGTYPINPQSRRSNVVTASTPDTSAQRNTDALRIRDEQAQQNVRQMEYKTALENQKQLLQNQQEEQKQLSRFVDTGIQYLSQDINRLNYEKGYVVGYVDDDNIDTSTTEGSSSFQPQTSTKQRLQLNEQEEITPFKDSVPQSDTMFAEDNSEPIGKPFELLGQSSEGEEDIQSPLLRPITKKKQQPMTAYLQNPNENDEEQVISRQPTAPFKKPKEPPKQKASLNEEIKTLQRGEGAGKEGIGGFNLPNVPVTKSEFFSPTRIPKSKGRPTREELDLWKEWYLLLQLKDDDVLASNRREVYQKPILVKLKEQYTDLRGNDPSVLKSKDAVFVYKAIQARIGLK
jgi:hypothetical protein